MSIGKVELHPACEWTCDSCGRKNFESVILEFISGVFVTRLDEVTCKSCGSTFYVDDGDDQECD